MRVLGKLLLYVVGFYAFAYLVMFASGSLTVGEPRVIDPDRITPPGTELRIGEEAFVRESSPDEDGIVAITVTSIEPGDLDLFRRMVENSQGFAPHYIRATMENVSPADLGDAVLS
jgi:hypothetical protein